MMNLRIREESPFNIWPSVADIALSLLLVLVLFILLQFIAYTKILDKLRIEEKQQYIRQMFEQTFSDEIASKKLQIREDGNIQQFTFSDRVLFETGQADLLPEGRQLMLRVGQLLRTHQYIPDKRGEKTYAEIHIEGHTDDAPIVTLRHLFPSNWELSSARAMAVLRLFVDEVALDPVILSATGYGEFRPTPLPATFRGLTSVQLEQAKESEEYQEYRRVNRRIEIKLIYAEDDSR